MKNIFKISAALLFVIVLVSCGNTSETKENGESKESIENADSEHNESEEGEGTALSLQIGQLDIMNIEMGQVKSIDLGKSLKVNGQLELPPQKQASVSAIIGGRVQDVKVIEGDKVRKGQVIARLSNPEFISMQQEYLSAKSNIAFLEKDYLRKKELLKEGITSSKSFQQIEAAYFEGQSTLNASKATLQLMGVSLPSLEKGKIVSSIPVIAPIDGYIQNVEINMGKYVSPEQEMFEIVNNEHLHLGLKVFEKDIDLVSVGQKIRFSLTTRPDKIYEAEIFAVGKAFDMESRAVKVHAKIVGNHEGLLTGMFVDARIVIESKKVDALPEEAFVSEKGLDYVFIQKEKEGETITFEKVQVNKGTSDLGYSEVFFIHKIPENTVIVINGAYYLNSEMQKSEFGDDD